MIRLPPISKCGQVELMVRCVDQIQRLLTTHILWIGMAWNKSGHEGRSVQVNLLTENEITIKSLVWTIMEDGDGFLFSTIRNAVKCIRRPNYCPVMNEASYSFRTCIWG